MPCQPLPKLRPLLEKGLTHRVGASLPRGQAHEHIHYTTHIPDFEIMWVEIQIAFYMTMEPPIVPQVVQMRAMVYKDVT